tara:strand:- start:513 stop:662 length:150 start_codon:yes stop_codon:yes gene_type:complete
MWRPLGALHHAAGPFEGVLLGPAFGDARAISPLFLLCGERGDCAGGDNI